MYSIINNIIYYIPYLIYVSQFLFYFFLFVGIDRILGNKIKGKYYLIHFIANMIIVYLTLPDVIFTYTNFLLVYLYPINYHSAMVTFSLHFYHIYEYYNSLKFQDWLHHITMIFISLPLGILANSGSLLGHGLFYLTGLPGGIDYLLLCLNRNEIISKYSEKRINTTLNLWIRSPGCIIHSALTIISLFMNFKLVNYIDLYASIITSVLIFWNGIYFMNRVVSDYAIVTYKKIT